MSDAPRERYRPWTVPLILAAVMSVGLVSALLADGPWDVLASAALAGVLLYAIGKGLAS